MTTRELRNAFKNLKFSDNEHSPSFFESDGMGSDSTSGYRAEMLEYKTNSKEMPEKPCIKGRAYTPDLKFPSYVYKKPSITEDSYYCMSRQRAKRLKEKCKGTFPVAETVETKMSGENCNETLPEAKTLSRQRAKRSKEKCKGTLPVAETVETKMSGENCNETLPEAKTLPNNYIHGCCNNPGKSVNRVKNYTVKKILTSKEKNLLEILKRSGKFRKVNAPFELNNSYSVNTDTCKHGKSALADNKSPESDLPVGSGDNDGCDDIPPCGWVLTTRYTQADRMASPPIILSELWDDEEEW